MRNKIALTVRLFALAAAFCIAGIAWGATETVGGYTWPYRINGDTAEIYGNWYSSPAISPKPTGAVVIPSTLGDKPVTSIGYLAFYNCSGLTSVTIPDSVTSIGDCAFYNCSGLTSVTIPDSVTSIGDFAFYNCSGLTSVTIPDSVTSIGWDAFYGCNALTSVTIPDSVTSIGYSAFSGCSGLTSVTIPDSVTSIGDSAFSGCSGLTSVTIPDSVTSIGQYAFSGCSGLTSVTIPDSVTSIGNSAFYNCSGLTSVTIPDSVTSIGYYAFAYCGGLTDFVVSEGNPSYKSELGLLLTKDGTTLVAGVNGDVTIPDSVTSIGDRAFYGCSGLTSVTIGNGVTSIGNYAFSGCSGLTSVTIPNGVTSIEHSAFSGCSGLTSVTIPNGVTSIEHSAFSGCSGLTSVTIGNSVTSIGDWAFENCSGLTSVTIPDSVTSIGQYAFFACSCLMSILVDESNPNYKSVNGLLLSKDEISIIQGINGNVTIPDSVMSIGTSAFSGRSGLTSVTIPDSVTSIGDRAFYNCSGLTSVTIPDSVTSIGEYAFHGCSSLETIYVPLDLIGSISFYGTSATVVGYSPTFQVTFDANGGVGGFSKKYSFGEVVTPPDVVSREGYTFIGWYPWYPEFETGLHVSDTTYTALWEANKHTVTFDANGGTGGTSEVMDYGSEIVVPTVTRTGYTFKGWDKNVATTVPDDDVTYTAQWEINQYVVTFDANGGEGGTSGEQDYNTPIVAPSVSRVGYTFAGWAPEVDAVVPAQDVTYIAQWTINKHTITFDANGGFGDAIWVLDYGTVIIAPTVTRTGYNFKGWDKTVATTVPDDDVTYTAQWEINQYVVTFDANGGEGGTSGEQDYNTPIVVPSVSRIGYTFAEWSPEVDEVVPARDVTYVAQWTINKHTITFDANGGTGGTSEVMDYGSEIVAPTVSRTGYTFKGWDKELVATVPDEDITYTAQWEINQYVVTFDATGGEGGTSGEQDYNTPIIAPSVSRVGYTFAGWSPEVDAVVPAQDVTYVAQWTINKHIVTFDANGGTGGTSEVMDLGTTIIAPTVSRTGYTFKGWDKELVATVPDEDITYTAQWTINQYTVTFDANGGVGGTSVTQDYATEIVAPVVTREGYTFVGWDKEVASTVPANDVKYVAQWQINQYSVTFNANGGEGGTSATQDYATEIVAPTVTREGYTFTGWSPEVAATVPAEDVTCTAQWEINQYTITFDANGGDGGTSEKQDYLTDIVAPTVTREGYTFVGWDKEVAPTVPASDVTYVAQWQVNQYDVVFDANGGEGGTSVKQDYATEIVAPMVTREGYTFTGWSPEVAATVPANDVTYTAQWEINQYTVTFDANGGEGGKVETLDYGSAILAPTVEREWHNFIGWSPSVDATVPAGDVTYAAQWKRFGDSISAEDIGGKTMKELYPEDYADMTEVVLEDGILELPEGFFDGCESLVNLTLPSTLETIGLDDLPPRIKERQSYGEDGFMVYEGWVLGHSDENATSLTLPEVSGIGSRAFAGFYYLETVALPETLSRIGREAFCYDTSLDDVVIPDGVTTICASAFKGCTYLRSITMGSGVKKVGASAFAVCTQLTTFTIPDSVVAVGDCAFSNCWRMLSVRLPLGVEVAGNEIFADCTSLVGVTVPAGRFTMRRLLGAAFEQITSAVVVEGEAELCANAFAGCGSLESVLVQSGVTNINEQAFASCSSLVDVSLPETLVAIGEHSFRGCSALEAIVLPDSVESIGDGAFKGCTDLSSVTLSRSLAEIPNSAFDGCNSLVSIVVPASVTRLGGNISTALRALYFLGNAPEYDANAYALMPDDATTYVVHKTRGWDGIPSSMDLPRPEIGWIGHPITFWTPNRFNAMFDANGGVFPNAAETYACEQITDTSYAMPPFEPVRTGYAFAGWWTDRSEGAQVKATTRVNETRDTTFYAHWMLVSKPVTVRFHANGGTVDLDEDTYYAGLPFETLPVPTKEHYVFAGWFTMLDGGTEVIASSEVPSADTELFAHWTPETYTIRYNANGGSGVMADQQFSYGASVTLAVNSFSRQGCVFVGWGVTEDGPVVYTDQKEIGTFGAIQGGVVNLYAQWTVPRYAVRYDSNGGVGVMTNDTFMIGVSGELSLNAFTRPGYVFIGWATTVDGEVAYGDGETVVDLTATANGNVSLFAVWARNTSNVEFSFDGDSPWRPARFARDGEAVWQSGAICDSEISDIVATVNGNGTISFEWSSSCEESYKGVRQDYLAFFVDGEEIDYINGSSAWATKSWTVSGDGPHVLKWSYIKDSLDAGHDDCARITRVVWEPGLNTLAEFANAPNVTFSTTGDAVWFGQTAVSHDGVAALQSGSILDGEETRLECAVVGAGELSFWWKSSCEEPHKGNPQDYASFVLDGVRQTWIAGETDWTNVVIRIDGNQRHNLCWIFQKDVSDSDGNDCAWLDEVIWTPSGPVIEGDDGADITGDSENGYTVRPSDGKKDVVVTIPEGVEPGKVTVEVTADVETVKANGAKVKVMNEGHDIAAFLDLAAVTSAGGVINLAEAKVKDDVAKEALDTASGADIKLSPTDPSITTANTRPGLKYTFVEGRTIEELAPTEQYKWGDNTPFKPTPSIKGGTSGFYTIKVEK